MQANKEIRMGAALVCVTALAGAVLVVRADCGNSGTSINDAETVCHDCATDAWSTNSCTWHLAESGDAYCGVCKPGYNCGKVGTHLPEKVLTYSNAFCTPFGCISGVAHTNPQGTPHLNSEGSCNE
jgi:hypothetical protein